MKIRKPTTENFSKVSGLLSSAFPKSQFEKKLVENFHANQTPIHEWVCIHVNKVIAYIAFSNAYKGEQICGLHLAPLAVAPEFQRQGIGSELVKFALRQKQIKESPLFVLGNPEFYQRFGFRQCATPLCPFDKNNRHFLSLGNTTTDAFTVGYEPEFTNS
ncbi:putative acetyltransferase [Desulforapulum autotrophicum HRM2]|uniref:Acetyltransferase n=1 Tax=Desulforapulum autotrophicum (strain ATCC 43914 / DSM 3382 / VKM B-1955 / HRM2) TaxID=177437 RepID=C0QF42_DESAH|nr:N-acetyltransferase [Desulforapulum autotrophicum]ACN17543.1 putative acetyltransferase [Desulforapulum autotrophicum HRM2]